MQFYAPQHLTMQIAMFFSHSDNVMVKSHTPYDNAKKRSQTNLTTAYIVLNDYQRWNLTGHSLFHRDYLSSIHKTIQYTCPLMSNRGILNLASTGLKSQGN